MFYYSNYTTCVDDDDSDEYRDENEGSIISSLISQLRCVCPSYCRFSAAGISIPWGCILKTY